VRRDSLRRGTSGWSLLRENQVAKVLSSWIVIFVDVIVDSKGAEDGYGI
jgi:hypothetical protein